MDDGVCIMKTTTSSTSSITPIDTKTEPKKTTSLSSPKFCRMMSADVGESGAERYRREMAERDRLDAERVKEAERRNLEERERMRAGGGEATAQRRGATS